MTLQINFMGRSWSYVFMSPLNYDYVVEQIIIPFHFSLVFLNDYGHVILFKLFVLGKVRLSRLLILQPFHELHYQIPLLAEVSHKFGFFCLSICPSIHPFVHLFAMQNLKNGSFVFPTFFIKLESYSVRKLAEPKKCRSKQSQK